MSEFNHLEILRKDLEQCEEALRLGIHDSVDRAFVTGQIVTLKNSIRKEEWERKQKPKGVR